MLIYPVPHNSEWEVDSKANVKRKMYGVADDYKKWKTKTGDNILSWYYNLVYLLFPVLWKHKTNKDDICTVYTA